MSTTIVGPDGKPRCSWCGAAPEFPAYHDTEWGFPVADDHRLFEKLSLEGFQSGLSWRTILVKRDNFRAAGVFSVTQICHAPEKIRKGKTLEPFQVSGEFVGKHIHRTGGLRIPPQVSPPNMYQVRNHAPKLYPQTE